MLAVALRGEVPVALCVIVQVLSELLEILGGAGAAEGAVKIAVASRKGGALGVGGGLQHVEGRHDLPLPLDISGADGVSEDHRGDALAQDIGSYKPAPANFEYLLANLEKDFRLGRKDILHTAQSLFHDHVPAKSFGLANAWIDRQRLSESGSWGATAKVDAMPDIDFKFFSMGEMAAAVATEE